MNRWCMVLRRLGESGSCHETKGSSAELRGVPRLHSSEYPPHKQVRVEHAFQTTEPFGKGYIEAPDPAYAPSTTGWHRHDTNFQLLVYCEGAPGERRSRVIGQLRWVLLDREALVGRERCHRPLIIGLFPRARFMSE